MLVPWPPIHLVATFDNDVGAEIDGAAQITTGAEGVVYDQRNAVGVGDLRQCLEVGDVEARVADGLDIDRLGVGIDGALEIRRVVALDTNFTPMPRRGRVTLNWL
jgi:hypothetical protein